MLSDPIQVFIRSSRPEVFLRKGVLKICSKCTGEHRWWSVISIKLLCNFDEIDLRHGCYCVNLLHILRTPFPKNTSWRLLLVFICLTHILPWRNFFTKFCCQRRFLTKWIYLVLFLKKKKKFGPKIPNNLFVSLNWR